MTSLFISYGRGDDSFGANPASSFVKRLADDLRGVDFKVWLDRDCMPSRDLTFHQEIRDAVSACDRLLLVVGPSAVSSDYVRQEWQFAYFQADKIVTPILRNGDYSLLPDELEKIHCEDFRNDDDKAYKTALKHLSSILSDPPPPLGQLSTGVPALPEHFLSRSDYLMSVRAALRADLEQPVVVSGAATRVGLHGMGGIGKSVLASAAAHDRQVRLAFPDGIIWVSLSQSPHIANLQQSVCGVLGEKEAIGEDEGKGKQLLKRMLADKAVLLILDDAWNRQQIDSFDVLGPRCRAIITSRDSALLASVGCVDQVVDLLTSEDATTLLAQTAGVKLQDLPTEASQVLNLCGCLPLAIALVGGMIRGGTTWRDVHHALETHDLQDVENPYASEPHHRNLWKTIEVSDVALDVSGVPLDGNPRRRLAELAVFPSAETIPEAAVITLWTQDGELSPERARKLLATLHQRSLVQLSRSPALPSENPHEVSLHKLIHDFCTQRARTLFGNDGELHNRLLGAYSKQCPHGWASGPNDGYFFTHLRDHLLAGGRVSELPDLLQELRWLEAKTERGLIFDLARDFECALASVPATDSRVRRVGLIYEALRRDIHFIHSNYEEFPHTLFQCLWNSCWWQDNPLLETHCGPPNGAEFARDVSEPIGTDDALFSLMERWHAERLQATGGFLWLKALRPPPRRLTGRRDAVLGGHDYRVDQIAFLGSSGYLVTGDGAGVVRLWDLASLAELDSWACPLSAEDGAFTAMAASNDDLQFAVGTSDGRVLLFSALQRKLTLEREEAAHEGAVVGLGFSKEREALVSGSADGTVREWLLTEQRESWHAAVGKRNWSCKTAPRSRRKVDAAYAGFRAFSGKYLFEGQELRCFSVSPKGDRLACYLSDGTLTFLDPTCGARRREYQMGPSLAHSQAFSADGKYVACGVGIADGGAIVLGDEERTPVNRILRGHAADVISVAFCSNGHLMISGALDNSVRVWETRSGREVSRSDWYPTPVEAIAIDPADSRRVAIGVGTDVLLMTVDQLKQEMHVVAHSNAVTALAVDFEGEFAASACPGGVRIWDMQTGTHLGARSADAVSRLTFCQRPRRLVIGSPPPGDVEVWNWESGQSTGCFRHDSEVPLNTSLVESKQDLQRSVLRTIGGGRLRCLDVSNDGSVILTAVEGKSLDDQGGEGNQIALWETSTGKVRLGGGDSLGGRGDWTAGVIFPDRKAVATGHKSGEILVIDVQTGIVQTELKGHVKQVNHLAISPNGRHLASGAEDGTLRVWNLQNGQCISCHMMYCQCGRIHNVDAVVFAPDGVDLWTQSDDGVVREWDLSWRLCSAAIYGYSDVGGSGRVPGNDRWWFMRVSNDSAIFRSRDSRVVARLPALPKMARAAPQGNKWVCALGNHIQIYVLEGVGGPRRALQSDRKCGWCQSMADQPLAVLDERTMVCAACVERLLQEAPLVDQTKRTISRCSTCHLKDVEEGVSTPHGQMCSRCVIDLASAVCPTEALTEWESGRLVIATSGAGPLLDEWALIQQLKLPEIAAQWPGWSTSASRIGSFLSSALSGGGPGVFGDFFEGAAFRALLNTGPAALPYIKSVLNAPDLDLRRSALLAQLSTPLQCYGLPLSTVSGGRHPLGQRRPLLAFKKIL